MTRLPLFALLLAMPGAAAVAQTHDRAPVALPSASRLTHDSGESWTYLRPGLNLRAFRSIMIEQAVVYTGPDAQFGEISTADRRRYAGVFTERVRAEVGRSGVPIVARAAAGTARLRFTILGMTETMGGVATATRVTPLGIASTALRSMTGRQGRLTGSILVAIEVFDHRGQLQAAAVRRRAPDALDIPATLGMTETVQAIGRGVGRDVRERFSGSR